MIWPFRRRRKEKPLPPINEDWRPGDLAECIDGRPWSGDGPGPAKGQISRVTRVTIDKLQTTGEPAYGLGLEGFAGLYNAAYFRKLRPVHEACDVGFAALIKRPRRTEVDA